MTPPIGAFMLSRMLARSAAREFACWIDRGHEDPGRRSRYFMRGGCCGKVRSWQ